MIASLTETGQYQAAMEEILRRDRLLARDDYKLWPDIAIVARDLATNTSVGSAQQTLDKLFQRFPSKLRSDVWPLLPKSSIGRLAEHTFSTELVYAEGTQTPNIRRDIERFVASHPAEPFVEFAYLTIGEFDKALAANPKSVIADVLHYAKANQMIGTLISEQDEYLKAHPADGDGKKRLAAILPDFAARAATARPHLMYVLQSASKLPHADDAAFWLGWLAYQQNQDREALQYFTQAMVVGNGDYRIYAVRWSLKILAPMKPQEQADTIASSQGLNTSSAAWYFASRSAYREFDYPLAIRTAERGLAQLKVPSDRLPATTARVPLEDAIDKLLNPGRVKSPDKPDDDWNYVDVNMSELAYVLQASRELSQYEASLHGAATEPPQAFAKRVRAMVMQYSTPADEEHIDARPGTQHMDYRQALRLIDVTLENAPRSVEYQPLRQWLYYRRVRLLVDFAPTEVPDAVSLMEREFPAGDLMDDALAEQLFVAVTVLRDPAMARAVFRKIVDKFPKSNAVDNAYNWMAIMLHCTGQGAEARKMDADIIRRFPLTRHAYYAVMRLAKPPDAECSDGKYNFGRAGPQFRMLRNSAIYQGPGRQNHVLLPVSAGVRIAVTEKRGDWLVVKLGQKTGYVAKDDVQCFVDCYDFDHPN